MARRWARQNVDALLPFARRGVPIVGTEPSCILTFRDEYPDLLRDEDSRTVAGQTLLLDELIARVAAEDGSVRSLFRDDLKRELLLHAHCHQKSLFGTNGERVLLERMGARFTLLVSDGKREAAQVLGSLSLMGS